MSETQHTHISRWSSHRIRLLFAGRGEEALACYEDENGYKVVTWDFFVCTFRPSFRRVAS